MEKQRLEMVIAIVKQTVNYTFLSTAYVSISLKVFSSGKIQTHL